MFEWEGGTSGSVEQLDHDESKLEKNHSADMDPLPAKESLQGKPFQM